MNCAWRQRLLMLLIKLTVITITTTLSNAATGIKGTSVNFSARNKYKV